jgi:hypothetical protein
VRIGGGGGGQRLTPLHPPFADGPPWAQEADAAWQAMYS